MAQIESDRPLVKIAFRDSAGEVETLWAFDLGGRRYQLDNSSWFQYGVSYNDIVEASVPRCDLHVATFVDRMVETFQSRLLYMDVFA